MWFCEAAAGRNAKPRPPLTVSEKRWPEGAPASLSHHLKAPVTKAWRGSRQGSNSVSQKGLLMTPLRQRMIDDMRVRNLSPLTQSCYLQQVSLFARYFHKSPEELGPDEIRTYQVYLTNERKFAPASIGTAIAPRFLYKISLKREWPLQEVIPAPKSRKNSPSCSVRRKFFTFSSASAASSTAPS
jgi:hypothetical protein